MVTPGEPVEEILVVMEVTQAAQQVEQAGRQADQLVVVPAGLLVVTEATQADQLVVAQVGRQVDLLVVARVEQRAADIQEVVQADPQVATLTKTAAVMGAAV